MFPAFFSTDTTMDSTTVWFMTTNVAMNGGWGPLDRRVPLKVPTAAPRINWRNGTEPDSIRGKSIFSKKKS